MKIKYSREEDILTIQVANEGVVDHAEHDGPFITHFDLNGQLLLLEILDASEFLSALIKATIRGDEQELLLATE